MLLLVSFCFTYYNFARCIAWFPKITGEKRTFSYLLLLYAHCMWLHVASIDDRSVMAEIKSIQQQPIFMYSVSLPLFLQQEGQFHLTWSNFRK